MSYWTTIWRQLGLGVGIHKARYLKKTIMITHLLDYLVATFNWYIFVLQNYYLVFLGMPKIKTKWLPAPFGAAGENKYRCYYPHWSRDSVSPVCGIFEIDTQIFVNIFETQTNFLHYNCSVTLLQQGVSVFTQGDTSANLLTSIIRYVWTAVCTWYSWH